MKRKYDQEGLNSIRQLFADRYLVRYIMRKVKEIHIRIDGQRAPWHYSWRDMTTRRSVIGFTLACGYFDTYVRVIDRWIANGASLPDQLLPYRTGYHFLQQLVYCNILKALSYGSLTVAQLTMLCDRYDLHVDMDTADQQSERFTNELYNPNFDEIPERIDVTYFINTCSLDMFRFIFALYASRHTLDQNAEFVKGCIIYAQQYGRADIIAVLAEEYSLSDPAVKPPATESEMLLNSLNSNNVEQIKNLFADRKHGAMKPNQLVEQTTSNSQHLIMLVQLLPEIGVDIGSAPLSGLAYHLVNSAAKHGHIEVIDYIRQLPESWPTHRHLHTPSPMVQAAENGHLQLVRYLHEHIPECRGVTQPSFSVCSGSMAMVKWFVEHDLPLRKPTPIEWMSAFTNALNVNRDNILAYLCGLDITLPDDVVESLRNYVFESRHSHGALSTLFDRFPSLLPPSTEHLYIMCKRANYVLLQLVLARTAVIGSSPSMLFGSLDKDNQLLIHAVSGDSLDIVTCICEHHPRLELQVDPFLIYQAAVHGNMSLIHYLRQVFPNVGCLSFSMDEIKIMMGKDINIFTYLSENRHILVPREPRDNRRFNNTDRKGPRLLCDDFHDLGEVNESLDWIIK
ncbi:hypothetical protein SAMD00019534_072590 [Acytostelium subglobosum LB1]|uniref:hypothetical protein n=1 Tax=Acytostelium subglobosum LB1 TaxID=1410327 RepID=UPI000644B00E|nr:hypothetical protein SAMD00019534_072590 [Acytostelium subglobosum LB1]GAM24084.1 hypothetical protein SAMD00019534_072590 [Acytostelium subglobosum LB1]|eukprot:XP_012753120.1 hypothetical protein SAMD00019534_072590 [Acytostelium subglobosum LB1]